MLCAPVFIFTSGSSALLGRPRCGLATGLSLLATFHTLFWVDANFFFFFYEETDKTWKYSKSAIFVWYENGRRWSVSTCCKKCLRFWGSSPLALWMVFQLASSMAVTAKSTRLWYSITLQRILRIWSNFWYDCCDMSRLVRQARVLLFP